MFEIFLFLLCVTSVTCLDATAVYRLSYRPPAITDTSVLSPFCTNFGASGPSALECFNPDAGDPNLFRQATTNQAFVLTHAKEVLHTYSSPKCQKDFSCHAEEPTTVSDYYVPSDNGTLGIYFHTTIEKPTMGIMPCTHNMTEAVSPLKFENVTSKLATQMGVQQWVAVFTLRDLLFNAARSRSYGGCQNLTLDTAVDETTTLRQTGIALDIDVHCSGYGWSEGYGPCFVYPVITALVGETREKQMATGAKAGDMTELVMHGIALNVTGSTMRLW